MLAVSGMLTEDNRYPLAASCALESSHNSNQEHLICLGGIRSNFTHDNSKKGPPSAFGQSLSKFRLSNKVWSKYSKLSFENDIHLRSHPHALNLDALNSVERALHSVAVVGDSLYVIGKVSSI